MKEEQIRGMLLGLALGDALGVPVEFMSRAAVRRQPVTGMQGYGTHHQPPGTWSDDASLTFCLAEALFGPDTTLLSRLATNMVRWADRGYWTAHGTVFDIGLTTARAIARLRQGTSPERAGDADEQQNGNGSLMRILPVLLLIRDKPIQERYVWTARVSAVTHRHVRSVMACFYYLELALQIEPGTSKQEAYERTNVLVSDYWASAGLAEAEIRLFDRLTGGRLAELPDDAIESSGYVLHTLEAAVWCWLTTETYAEAVLRAVNLGSDTDTTGAVTGGLAGLYYGAGQLPGEWLQTLARLADIDALSRRLAARIT